MNNRGDDTMKSAKILLSGSKSIKAIVKDGSSSISLAKNVKGNSQTRQKVTLKCKDYMGGDALKCKLMYTLEVCVCVCLIVWMCYSVV